MLRRNALLSASAPWRVRQANDAYVQRAAKEGFIARSAFKLLEIDDKFRLFDRTKRQVVIDLGAAPGGWSQVVRRRSTPDSVLIGVDRSPMAASLVGYRFIQGDFTDPAVLDKLRAALQSQQVSGDVDVVVSDMCPNRTGQSTDRFQLAELDMNVLLFAKRELRVGGHLVMKLLGGDAHYGHVIAAARRHFANVAVWKPDASRSQSDESFAVATCKLAQSRDAPVVSAKKGEFLRHPLDGWPGAVKFKLRTRR